MVRSGEGNKQGESLGDYGTPSVNYYFELHNFKLISSGLSLFGFLMGGGGRIVQIYYKVNGRAFQIQNSHAK